MLSYFNKFGKSGYVFSYCTMFCNGRMGEGTMCQNERHKVQRGKKIRDDMMWTWYINGFNFRTKYEMYIIFRINRNWICGSHLLHIAHILRRHLELLVILTERLQKIHFQICIHKHITSHNASKLNTILEKYFKIKMFRYILCYSEVLVDKLLPNGIDTEDSIQCPHTRHSLSA